MGKVGVEGHEEAKEETHLVCLIIHAIFCADIALAAAMRSPSFSRPSSSMTTRNLPRANTAMASSTASNANAVRVGRLGTSWGRAGEAEAGMRGKSVGTETPLALRGERGADWGWAASATGAMMVGGGERTSVGECEGGG